MSRPLCLSLCLVLAGCEAAPSVTYAPYAPKRVTLAQDTPFLQELNHLADPADADVGPLVGVVRPPTGYTSLETPTQVTPRGLLRHVSGAPTITPIDASDEDLLGAATTSDAVYLAGPHAIYTVAPDLTLTKLAVPDARITAIAAGQHTLYAATDHGLLWISPSVTHVPTSGPPVDAVAEAGSTLYVAAESMLSAYDSPADALAAPRWSVAAPDVRALVAQVTLPSAIDVVAIANDSITGFVAAEAGAHAVEVPAFAAGRVPLGKPRAAALASDGGFIVATAGGAYRLLDRGMGAEWRVYNADRWLPSGDVRGLATDPAVADGPIWFATAGGLATVTAKRMTIEDKLAGAVERIVSRHDREGAVADSHLPRRGDLSSNIPWDSDNDGTWTSYWTLGECFRYAVTGDPAAKAHFDEALEAMLRLRTLTGTDSFIARSVIRKAGCMLDDCDNPDDGDWFDSPDGAFWVKRDTSNDEVIAHAFQLGHAYDVCADATQRTRIAAHVRGLVGGIIDNGWRLIDPITKEPTRYGHFEPAYVNEGVEGPYGDGGVISAEALALMTLAHYMTGEQRFLDAKHELIASHHYADNAEKEASYLARPFDGDNDEMALEAWFVLLRYEPDAALRARWLAGWKGTYASLRPQQAALWDVVNAVVGGDAPDLAMAKRWWQLSPVDFIRWDMHNAQRLDLVDAPSSHDGAKIRSDGKIIPGDERPINRFNTDQYRVDGGEHAWLEGDGAEVLMPYWAARYYGFIDKP